nr:retrotransposon protein, putative, unclassified [Tanacetum cinerariifolium]
TIRPLYELFHGKTPSLSFMRPFRCPVTILNTLDPLGSGLTWIFDIDTLTKSMNYKTVVAGNQSNGSAGKAKTETVPNKDYILLPLWTQDLLLSSSSKDSLGDGFKPLGDEEKKDAKNPRNEDNKDNAVDEIIIYGCANDSDMPNLEEIVYSDEDEDVGAEADMTNLDTNIPISPILTTKIHKDHPVEQIIRDIHSAPQNRRMTKNVTNYVYQMDMKSAFLYGKIEEEVYVYQPLGFENPEFPDRVYKVEKALYGLHQDLRASKEICTEFEKMMHKKFQMSYMGELTFFLGLQVTQTDDGIFISQDKYVDEILKKFGFSTVKTASAPMENSKPLLKDEDPEDVDVQDQRLAH